MLKLFLLIAPLAAVIVINIKKDKLLEITEENFGCLSGNSEMQKDNSSTQDFLAESSNYQFFFLEFGSTGCISCKKMETVMQKVEDSFNGRIKVLFFNVRTREGMKYADLYKIYEIPVQVILDNAGNELFRHTGYISYSDMVGELKKYGLH